MHPLIKCLLVSLALACLGAQAAPYAALGTLNDCRAYPGRPDPAVPTEEQWVEGGSFILGSNTHYAEEAPARQVTVEGFWIDRHEVTNAQYRRFVEATGYRTLAERGLNRTRFPGLPEPLYRPGSTVFVAPTQLAFNSLQWWTYIEGANWQHPTGPDSSIADLDNHPVVHIAYEDAKAYADWMGRALPTEAQYEYAAKGATGTTFPWGKVLNPHGRSMANTWDGAFPLRNGRQDGFAATAPVGCYPANNFALYDMVGNVWEWVSDRWTPDHGAATVSHPDIDLEDNLSEQARGTELGTIKGGSYLCSPSYCKRYRPSSRHAQDLTMGTNHIGFRTVSIRPGP
ncbi:formylglycine-generating enzyme family protein [Pseudomonas sp. R5(2019)]|uniref:formylglycine-generating enzyme family protein n=1 Tax=Pseudomonas sp. R5(2019) TaxID=2697566 RepID=UPI0014130CE0|nr:formylglycine-generating enzyme family protein [Pseudomonas sp. R5(2019)]NBA96270.1 SUMF1/EgtB/PvdO family nonheme iron enzyme [Pseudomonas sp. R5(2019)]